MKNILFGSACLMAMTGFGGVLLSEAHSHTMDVAWTEQSIKDAPSLAVLKPSLAPEMVMTPIVTLASNWSVSQTPPKPLPMTPQMQRVQILDDLAVTTSLRPKMRPDMLLASVTAVKKTQRAPVARSAKNVTRPAPTSDLSVGTVSRNSNLSTPYAAPSEAPLQRWLADRPHFGLGTQVGVFR